MEKLELKQKLKRQIQLLEFQLNSIQDLKLYAMKIATISRLLIFLLISSIAEAQSGGDIPKKVNLIEVNNDKLGKDNFIHIKNVLSDNNIEVKSQDTDILLITTDYMPDGHSSYVSLLLKCKDSVILISGKYYNRVLKGDPTPIENIGMKGSMFNRTFNKMNEIALKLGNNIVYKIRKN